MQDKHNKFMYIILVMVLIFFIDEILPIKISISSLEYFFDFNYLKDNWIHYLSGTLMIIFYLLCIYSLKDSIYLEVISNSFNIRKYFFSGLKYGLFTYLVGYGSERLFNWKYIWPLQSYDGKRLLLIFIVTYWIITILFKYICIYIYDKENLVKKLEENQIIFKTIVATSLTIMSVVVSVQANNIYKQQLAVASKDIAPVFSIQNSQKKEGDSYIEFCRIETNNELKNVRIICQENIYHLTKNEIINVYFDNSSSMFSVLYNQKTRSFSFKLDKEFYNLSENYKNIVNDPNYENITYAKENPLICEYRIFISYTDSFGKKKNFTYELNSNFNDIYISESGDYDDRKYVQTTFKNEYSKSLSVLKEYFYNLFNKPSKNR